MKKNKTRINGKYLHIIKGEYFNGKSAQYIADKYGYELYAMQKYLKSRATKTYIAPDGKRYRRCSICNIYRLEEEYSTSINIRVDKVYLTAQCKGCDSRRKKNKYIIQKNMGEGWKRIRQGRETWYKHKWKYNTKRKIMKIIGYKDVNGKINKNYEELIRKGINPKSKK